MNVIDLSKIPVKEQPSKVIKANFEGEEKEYTIYALTDAECILLDSICADETNVYRNKNIFVFLVSAGMKIAPQVAERLFDYVPEETVRVGNEVRDFTKDVNFAKAKEVEEAEKN